MDLPLPAPVTWVLVLLAGLALLVKAADWFTGAAERIGLAFGLPPFLVGVTIVAFGTSLPELVSSVLAVLRGASEIVAGNVVGSNIANLLLVMGLAAVLGKGLQVKHNLLRVDLPFLAGSAFFLAMVLWDGGVSRVEALFCLFGLILYIHYALYDGRGAGGAQEVRRAERGSLAKPALVLAGAGALVYLAAEAVVASVIALAALLGFGTEVIAATAVALGTSLPEVSVTVAAARTARSEMAVGNLLGSNVFNAFAVVGISALVGPLTVPADITSFALPLMVVVTVLIFFIMLAREMTTWVGWLMMMLYAYFIATLFELV